MWIKNWMWKVASILQQWKIAFELGSGSFGIKIYYDFFYEIAVCVYAYSYLPG